MRVAALFVAALGFAAAAAAGPLPQCRLTPILLWGDGRHDDTAALNAWFAGAAVRWAATGAPVGPEIAGRGFLLSGPLYVPSGTGRKMVEFSIVWPRTGERLAGGTIAAGRDPNAAPLVSGIVKIGGDPGEGVPFATPAGAPSPPRPPANCLVSWRLERVKEIEPSS